MGRFRKPKTSDFYDPNTGEFDSQGYDDQMDAWEDAEEEKASRKREEDSYFLDLDEDED